MLKNTPLWGFRFKMTRFLEGTQYFRLQIDITALSRARSNYETVSQVECPARDQILLLVVGDRIHSADRYTNIAPLLLCTVVPVVLRLCIIRTGTKQGLLTVLENAWYNSVLQCSNSAVSIDCRTNVDIFDGPQWIHNTPERCTAGLTY